MFPKVQQPKFLGGHLPPGLLPHGPPMFSFICRTPLALANFLVVCIMVLSSSLVLVLIIYRSFLALTRLSRCSIALVARSTVVVLCDVYPPTLMPHLLHPLSHDPFRSPFRFSYRPLYPCNLCSYEPFDNRAVVSRTWIVISCSY